MKPIAQTFPFAEIDELDLSHSTRGLFRSCPRKFEFRKLYNNSRRQEGLASGAGISLHSGIQHWLVYKDFEKAVWEMIRHYPIKFQKSWADANSLAGCYQTLVAMMNWDKLDQYEIAEFEKPDGTIQYGTEVGFNLRIKEYPFYPDGRTITVNYIGFIDLVLYDKLTGDYVVCDIKTTTRDTDKAVEFAFSEQQVPYGLVLEAALGRDPNKGFEVDYWSILIGQEAPKNKFLTFMKTANDLRDWMQGYLFDLDCIRRYFNLGWFARNGNSCMSWSRPCPSFDFCESRDPKVIELMLAQDSANQKVTERPEPWLVIDLDYAA